jgi:hypothetical protein
MVATQCLKVTTAKVGKVLHPCGGAVIYQPTLKGIPMKAYYTLCIFDADQCRWFDEIGDYDRNYVDYELNHHADTGVPKKHLKIIKTNGTLADLIAKRDALPAPKAKAAAAPVADLIDGVRNHARVNWDKGGWDILYECWDDSDIAQHIGGAKTLRAAIAACKRVLTTIDNHRAEIRATEW